jgi:hypothetical protein
MYVAKCGVEWYWEAEAEKIKQYHINYCRMKETA